MVQSSVLFDSISALNLEDNGYFFNQCFDGGGSECLMSASGIGYRGMSFMHVCDCSPNATSSFMTPPSSLECSLEKFVVSVEL